ncbi:redoxin family protein [Nitrosarchaeum koreense]|uniref:Redoxin domain protein n=1 Tax=Nitrosarchaeum koreense MY1 TaxID=1001994 RepID=F9CWK9_9ARCH|nr:redoxin family protein [Nitrosarchaeum koreense]EGP93661.1 Redoxin domain protein [Nitrosarchaeum koreense MY1]
MKSEIKTAIIFGMIIIGIVGTISVLLSSINSDIQTSDSSLETNAVNSIDKSKFKKAPQIVGIANYFNTTPEELAKEMKGKVVLYDIWTYSCINCVRTLPYIVAWNEKYSDEGLLIIGIHSPEFEFEKIPENVESAIIKHGIKYPVVMDNDMATWKAFENRYWPRKYIADDEGYIRYDHIGEGDYKETEKVIQSLLKERAMNLGLQINSTERLVDIKEFEHSNFRTPELYFGYDFAQGRNQLGSNEGFNPEKTVTYSEPNNIELHKFYPVGEWKNLEDSMELVSNNGSIKLHYNAKEVNIVTANMAKLEILLDGLPISKDYAGTDVNEDGKITVSGAGLYNIVNSNEPSSHILEIRISEPGFQMYTFTFG